MNQTERQKSWGWMIVLYIFLAGLGGGTFLFSFILLFIGKYEPIARIGALVGPLVVLFASALLLLDLGSPFKAYRLFTTPKNPDVFLDDARRVDINGFHSIRSGLRLTCFFHI